VNPLPESLEMLRKASEEHSLSWKAVFEWQSHLKVNQASAEDDKLSGRPSTTKMTKNAETLQELIHEDCHQTIKELTDTAGISHGV
jgi:hypothetical protein